MLERWIVFRSEKRKLTRFNVTDFWKDEFGTTYAFADDGYAVDAKSRCGIAPFALPDWTIFHDINLACGPHDYAYSSPVFQSFYTEAEADEYLERLQTEVGFPVLGWVFKKLSNLVGRFFWENKSTRI